jgi:DNA-binding transcriptional regulator/RsmH inhibitor MraZ
MFWGQWETAIDNKWRVNLPSSLNKKFNNYVLLKEGKNCLEIHRPLSKISKEDTPFMYFQEIKGKRFIIPRFLRKSKSFYFGRKIIIAGRGSYLEIWPRP